jgi:CxxC motif-containing protein (DUF1111 family)
VEMHGGEGTTARNNYMDLSPAKKDKLLKFLNSL